MLHFFQDPATTEAIARRMAEPDPFEKYSVIGLLYLVLASVGAFLVKVGFDLNKNIQNQTGAVNGLVTELRVMTKQMDNQAAALVTKLESFALSHTTQLTELREQLRDLRSLILGFSRSSGSTPE